VENRGATGEEKGPRRSLDQRAATAMGDGNERAPAREMRASRGAQHRRPERGRETRWPESRR
jgi:hypothetical protein